MKRFYTAVIIIICLMAAFSSCSAPRSAESNMREIREFLSGCESIDIKAAVTADYGDKVFEYTLKYSGSESSGTIEIVSPEIIAGIRAQVSFDDGIKLEYDGTVLDTGKLYEDGLSPVDAIPVMLKQWQEGYISGYSLEKHDGINCTVADMTVSDGVSLRTWFDSETFLPVYSEIAHNGYVVIKCDFENVSVS